jgi:hypothetical protein
MMTGTLMRDSDHPVLECLSEHLAKLECLRAVFAERLGATLPLHDEATRVLEEVDDDSSPDNQCLAVHEMPVSKTTAFLTARRALDNAELSRELLPASLLVAMVSQHDAFIGRLIRALFTRNPDLCDEIVRPVSYADCRSFETAAEVREKLIEDEIREVLQRSHRAQIGWLEKRLGMSLDKDRDVLARFSEVCQRRHVYAHNGGVATTKYVESRVAVDPGYGGRPGERLAMSVEEFEGAFSTLLEIAVKIWQATWRKVLPKERVLAERAIYLLGYNLLVFEQFEAARRVLECAISQPGSPREDIHRKNIINLAQAHKWLGDEKGCREVLRGDWSAAEAAFTLAIAVLEDDFVRAEQLMLRVGGKEEIVQQAFLDWPLFREFRKSEQFARAFERLYVMDEGDCAA